MTALLRLAVRCPSCGRPPSVRITPEARESAMQMKPDTFVATVQCTRIGCACHYPVTAEAFQRAA